MMIVVAGFRTLLKHDDVDFQHDIICLHILTGLERHWETDTVREQDRSGLTM